MSDAPKEDALIAELREAWTKEWGSLTHVLPGDAKVIGFAAAITVRRLRKAGISDLVIAKALVDEPSQERKPPSGGGAAEEGSSRNTDA